MAYNILNKQDLEIELHEAGDQLVIIDFYATWCGPCKIIDPQLHDLALQNANSVKFLKINVDDCEDIAMTYNVTSMPTFVFIKNQQIVDVVVGGNVEKLEKNIEKFVEGGQVAVTKLKTIYPKEEADIQDDDYDLEQDLDVDDLEDPTSVLEVIVDDHM